MKLPNIFEQKNAFKEYAAGETIFAAGDAPDFMYVVKTGEVGIEKDGKLVETLGPDGFFGEMALADSAPRSATAKARTGCELALISEKQFLFMVGETPFFSLVVLRQMAARLRRP